MHAAARRWCSCSGGVAVLGDKQLVLKAQAPIQALEILFSIKGRVVGLNRNRRRFFVET